eukprot:g45915.t1
MQRLPRRDCVCWATSSTSPRSVHALCSDSVLEHLPQCIGLVAAGCLTYTAKHSDGVWSYRETDDAAVRCRCSNQGFGGGKKLVKLLEENVLPILNDSDHPLVTKLKDSSITCHWQGLGFVIKSQHLNCEFRP